MCGISGQVGSFRTRVPDMVKAMAHRGPDGWRISEGGIATFGHNLLAVRGAPEVSRQPYYATHSELTFNGEIYDFGRGGIGNQLDTKVLAERLERYGPKVLNTVDGMYALAWYDINTGKVLLARDRLGSKPLYYAETPNGLMFASEYRGMFAGGVRKRLDPVGVRLYLQFGYVPGPRTLIQGMSKLYPGECREYMGGTFVRSWHTHTKIEPTKFSPKSYRKALVQAVERSLPSVRKTGLFLSGGMDSASVLWAMKVLGVRPQTMSMRFAGAGGKQALLDGDCDAALAMAELCGTEHVECLFTEADYMANLTEAFSCDEPISRKGMPAYLYANREAKNLGWTVAFTGDGGDELLSGYGKHLRLLKPGYNESQMNEPIATWIHMQSQGGAENAWYNQEAKDFDVDAYMRSWVPPVLLGTDRLRNELQLECITHLAEDFLLRADKLGMSQGLETRFPLLCEPFRSYALGLPSDIKTRDWVLKACARDAMRGHLPDVIIDKPKSGWGPPTGQWLVGKDKLVGPLGDQIRAMMVRGRVPAVDRLIDVEKIKVRIKATLALFYLMTWAETVGLEDA